MMIGLLGYIRSFISSLIFVDVQLFNVNVDNLKQIISLSMILIGVLSLNIKEIHPMINLSYGLLFMIHVLMLFKVELPHKINHILIDTLNFIIFHSVIHCFEKVKPHENYRFIENIHNTHFVLSLILFLFPHVFFREYLGLFLVGLNGILLVLLTKTIFD